MWTCARCSTHHFAALRWSFSWNFLGLCLSLVCSGPRTATGGNSACRSGWRRWTAYSSSWPGPTPGRTGSSPGHGSPAPNPLSPTRFLSLLEQKSPSPSPKKQKRLKASVGKGHSEFHLYSNLFKLDSIFVCVLCSPNTTTNKAPWGEKEKKKHPPPPLRNC